MQEQFYIEVTVQHIEKDDTLSFVVIERYHMNMSDSIEGVFNEVARVYSGRKNLKMKTYKDVLIGENTDGEDIQIGWVFKKKKYIFLVEVTTQPVSIRKSIQYNYYRFDEKVDSTHIDHTYHNAENCSTWGYHRYAPDVTSYYDQERARL
jgi:hypothetical protein